MVHVPVPFKHFMVTQEGCKLLSTVEPWTSKSGNLSEASSSTRAADRKNDLQEVWVLFVI